MVGETIAMVKKKHSSATNFMMMSSTFDPWDDPPSMITNPL